MLSFPNINPVAFQIGSLPVRWYGLMYVFAFLACYLFYRYILIPKNDFPIKKEILPDAFVYGFFGLILGARLFYVFVYNPWKFFENPMFIFEIWNGGLSFHGGFLGIVIALLIFTQIHKTNRWNLADRIMLPIPIALLLGRIGNFINGELYGRVTDANNFCMIFPAGGNFCRYPSQLFEAFGEGILLFVIINFLFFKTKLKEKSGIIFGLFIILYGIIRFFIEYTREPDAQIGYLFGVFSMGQILCFIMIIIGIIIVIIRNNHYKKLINKIS